MAKDPIAERYPTAKVIAPGYCYDFGRFVITRNISGTGGWVITYPAEGDPTPTTAKTFKDGVKMAESVIRLHDILSFDWGVVEEDEAEKEWQKLAGKRAVKRSDW